MPQLLCFSFPHRCVVWWGLTPFSAPLFALSLSQFVQGPCPDNQKALLAAKIIDTAGQIVAWTPVDLEVVVACMTPAFPFADLFLSPCRISAALAWLTCLRMMAWDGMGWHGMGLLVFPRSLSFYHARFCVRTPCIALIFPIHSAAGSLLPCRLPLAPTIRRMHLCTKTTPRFPVSSTRW